LVHEVRMLELLTNSTAVALSNPPVMMIVSPWRP
jgi:hypothetical protein